MIKLTPEFKRHINEYFDNKYLIGDDIKGLLIHNYNKEPPRTLLVKNIHNDQQKWVEGTPADMYKLQSIIKKDIVDVHQKNKKRLNKYVGYLSKFKKEDDMIFKVKDNSNARNKGARCDQSSKGNASSILKDIFEQGGINDHKKYFENATRTHLCVIQEIYLRYLNHINKNDNIWFHIKNINLFLLKCL